LYGLNIKYNNLINKTMSRRIEQKNLLIDFLEDLKPGLSDEERAAIASTYIDNKRGSKSGMLAEKAYTLIGAEDQICYAHGVGMQEVMNAINKIIATDGEKYSDGEVIDYIYYLIN